jgi:isopropylmalate/homocitrate/citramalate synthase
MTFEITKGVDEARVRREAILDDARGISLTSPLNRASSIAPTPLKRSVIIKDDTIRSGANTPGVYASNEVKLRIAQRLEEAGLVEIEAGYATVDEHVQFIRELKASGSKLRLSAHCDYFGEGWQGRIDRAVDAGVDVVNIVGMAGYLMPLGLHPHLDGEAAIERIRESAAYSKSKGAFTAIGTVAATLESFEAAVRAALDGGADRFYIYDTRGWYTPPVMAYLTRFVRDIVGDRMEIAIHCHDDFGMATANTVEAVRAGADLVDVTVIRTGHRCGNASLEQVVAALESIYGVDTGVKLEQLRPLCQFVAEEYGLTIPANAPVVGDSMYTYGGIHVTALLGGNWYIWENIKAEAVGHERNVVFGVTALQRTSANPVMAKIRQMQLEATPDQLEQIFARLHKLVEHQNEASVTEMERIIRDVLQAA